MATVYEIVQGLSQAAANAYDGALTEDGEPVTAGLAREDGDPLLDKRVLDGFKVKFYGKLRKSTKIRNCSNPNCTYQRQTWLS